MKQACLPYELKSVSFLLAKICACRVVFAYIPNPYMYIDSMYQTESF